VLPIIVTGDWELATRVTVEVPAVNVPPVRVKLPPMETVEEPRAIEPLEWMKSDEMPTA